MSSPAVQLSFALRTSPNARTVHLVGSWDGYKSQLPLSAAKDGKQGSWKGTFRFQGAHALKLGSRYWYYYIVDGYHVSHDPAKEHVVEKTTGRKLNILNVPAPVAKPKAEPKVAGPKVAIGRALSPSRIACPKPQKPHASKNIREAEYEMTLEQLEEHFTKVALSAERYASSPSEISECSEASGSVFSKTSGSSSATSHSDSDSGSCTCGRFGVTRDGRRVMLDCGGKRCGYADDSSDCESEDDDVEIRRQALVAERARNGIKTTAQVSSRGRVAARRN